MSHFLFSLQANAGGLLNFWFTMQLQLAAFVMLVWLLDRALPARWSTPRMRYLLWSTILLKALIPPVISLPGGEALPMASLMFAPAETTTAAAFPSASAGISVALVVLLLIAASSLVLAAIAFWRGFRLRSVLREAVRFDYVPAGDWPPIFISDRIPSPLAIGIQNPRIYVTPAIAEAPQDILHAVLQHERAHIRRRDAVAVVLQTLVQIIYVLNPLMWMANLRIFRFRELICDEEAMRAAGTRPQEYGRLLIDFAEAQPMRILQTGTCFFETRRGFVQRISELFNPENHMVMRWKHYVAVVALSLLIVPLSSQCDRTVTYTETYTEYPEDSLAAAQPLAEPAASVDYPVKSRMEYSKQEKMTSMAGPRIVGGMDALSAKIKYPEEALGKGIEGVVIIEAAVTRDGPASELRVLKSVDPALDQAALAAVKSVMFKAGYRNGKVIESKLSIPIKFRLK